MGGVTALHRSAAGPVQVVLFLPALLARVAFRAHLTDPQLSQHLVDLLGEFTVDLVEKVVGLR